MKKQILVVIALLTMGATNIGMVRAQPLEDTTLAPASLRAQLNVQRAEAIVQILALATETLKSQSAPADFARWPVALRDALPYWLEYQPFEAWSPELQQFAKEKFQKLAADTQVENFAPAAKNKAAIARWLQEKAPFESAQLRFFLNTRFVLIGKNLEGVQTLKQNQFVELSDYDTPRTLALGHFIGSLSPQQKSELFAHNMHLPVADLSQNQKQIFDQIFGDSDMKFDAPDGGKMSIRQSPKSEIALDFQFSTLVQRNVAGKEDYFEVKIARPFKLR